MSLNRRQKNFYLDIIDIYRPSDTTPGTNKKAQSRTYTLAYSSIPVLYVPTQDFESIAGLSQQTENNIMTQDRFHCDVTQEVFSNWRIVMKTPGHVYFGKHWVVQGDPMPVMARGRRQANFLEIYAKLSI